MSFNDCNDAASELMGVSFVDKKAIDINLLQIFSSM